MKSSFILFPSGRVPSIYRSPTAPREVLRLCLVQPPSSQAQVPQKAREKNATRGRARAERRTSQRKSRGQAEMGFASIGKAEKRHQTGVQRRLCSDDYGEKACLLHSIKSRSKRQNQKNRLFETSR